MMIDQTGDDDPAEHPSEYAWEQNFERTWEKVTVAPDGTLRTGVSRTWRAERPEVQENVKRGVLRTFFLVLDCSHHVLDSDLDMKPSRLAVIQDVCAEFITKFFEQNPISSLAVLITKEGRAEMLTEPSCNARQHLQALQRLGDCKGDASLQNVLELARQALESVASFVSREVLLLSASLSTSDPGDIHETIAHLKRQRVRCSVCSLLAEVYVRPHAAPSALLGGAAAHCPGLLPQRAPHCTGLAAHAGRAAEAAQGPGPHGRPRRGRALPRPKPSSLRSAPSTTRVLARPLRGPDPQPVPARLRCSSGSPPRRAASSASPRARSTCASSCCSS